MSKGVNKLLSRVTHSRVATVTSMVRAYDGPFIRSLDLKAMGPEINTEILYKAQIMRARVVEIPAHLDWSEQTERMKARKVSLRVSNTSKLLVFASFLFRPLVFFVFPGLAAADRLGLDPRCRGHRRRAPVLRGERQHRQPALRRLRHHVGAPAAVVHRRRLQLRRGRAADQPRPAGHADEALLRGAVPPGHVGAPARRPHRDQPHGGRRRAGRAARGGGAGHGRADHARSLRAVEQRRRRCRPTDPSSR